MMVCTAIVATPFCAIKNKQDKRKGRRNQASLDCIGAFDIQALEGIIKVGSFKVKLSIAQDFLATSITLVSRRGNLR